MQWDFSPEDVVKGRAGYGLEEFRTDLAQEVRLNTPDASYEERAATFSLLYDLCHWLARGEDLEGFLATLAYDPPTCEFLRGVHPAILPNVEMLGAILQRMIMDGVDAGMPLEEALVQAGAEHRRIVDGRMPAEVS
ncbi:MAG TPA: hypothetical protein VFV55_11110 [Usitatibacteraceae bacterium]|nr:hypothetical protein [Usitatibacteraceae bacterium]